MLTLAPATTPPEGSITVPVTLAEFPVCAMLAGTAANTPNRKNKVARNTLTDLINESPFMNGDVCAAQRGPRMNCRMKMEFDTCR
jgi:hypothetical protein